MANQMNLLQYPVTLFHKKVDSAIAAKMVVKFSGEMRRYPKKQQIDTRHTHTTKKLDETSLYLPGKQDILSQHNITKMDVTCHQQRWRYT